MTEREECALVRQWTPAVRSIVKKFRLPRALHVDHEDMMQWGYLALFAAVRTYRPESRMSLKSWIFKKVHYAIIDEIRKAGWRLWDDDRKLEAMDPADVPANQQRRYKRLIARRNKLFTQSLDRMEEVREQGHSESRKSPVSKQVASHHRDPFDEAWFAIEWPKVEEAMKELPARQRAAMDAALTQFRQTDLAEKMAISPSRVSQLYTRAARHIHERVCPEDPNKRPCTWEELSTRRTSNRVAEKAPPGKPGTDEEILELLKQGRSVESVRRALHTSHRRVAVLRDMHGIPKGPTGPRTKKYALTAALRNHCESAANYCENCESSQ